MAHIVIEISGGVLQEVYSNMPLQDKIIILNWDNLKEGDEPYVIFPKPLDNMDFTTDAMYQRAIYNEQKEQSSCQEE